MSTNPSPFGTACEAQAAKVEEALDAVIHAIDKASVAQLNYMAKLDEMIARLNSNQFSY